MYIYISEYSYGWSTVALVKPEIYYKHANIYILDANESVFQ